MGFGERCRAVIWRILRWGIADTAAAESGSRCEIPVGKGKSPPGSAGDSSRSKRGHRDPTKPSRAGGGSTFPASQWISRYRQATAEFAAGALLRGRLSVGETSLTSFGAYDCQGRRHDVRFSHASSFQDAWPGDEVFIRPLEGSRKPRGPCGRPTVRGEMVIGAARATCRPAVFGNRMWYPARVISTAPVNHDKVAVFATLCAGGTQPFCVAFLNKQFVESLGSRKVIETLASGTPSNFSTPSPSLRFARRPILTPGDVISVAPPAPSRDKDSALRGKWRAAASESAEANGAEEVPDGTTSAARAAGWAPQLPLKRVYLSAVPALQRAPPSPFPALIGPRGNARAEALLALAAADLPHTLLRTPPSLARYLRRRRGGRGTFGNAPRWLDDALRTQDGRKDLRPCSAIHPFTIDPPRSRDLDDAISVVVHRKKKCRRQRHTYAESSHEDNDCGDAGGNTEPRRAAESSASDGVPGDRKSLLTVDGHSCTTTSSVTNRQRKTNSHLRQTATVFVHISDVAHFIREKTRLDAAAKDRAVSCYMGPVTVPMLPPYLAHNVCSLLPHRPRLAVSLAMLLDLTTGQIVGKPSVFRSVIQSRARLTYKQVDDYFAHSDGSSATSGKNICGKNICGKNICVRSIPRQIRSQLNVFRALTALLRRRRGAEQTLQRAPAGSALVCRYTPGGAADFKRLRVERSEAHELVEEIMVCANRAVGQLLHQSAFTRDKTVFRVQGSADVSDSFAQSAVPKQFRKSAFASSAAAPEHRARRHPLRPLLARLQETLPAEIFESALFALRSKASPAEYRVPEEGGDCSDTWHDSLQLDRYVHFTSPIRRYADICVHRVIFGEGAKSVCGAKKVCRYNGKESEEDGSNEAAISESTELSDVAEHCSRKSLVHSRTERQFSLVMMNAWLPPTGWRPSHPVVVGVKLLQTLGPEARADYRDVYLRVTVPELNCVVNLKRQIGPGVQWPRVGDRLAGLCAYPQPQRLLPGWRFDEWPSTHKP